MAKSNPFDAFMPGGEGEAPEQGKKAKKKGKGGFMQAFKNAKKKSGKKKGK